MSIATAKSYIYNVRLFHNWCIEERIVTTQATKFDVQMYVMNLRERLAPGTIPVRCASMRAFFDFCVEYELRKDNPASGLSVRRPDLLPEKPFARSEIKRLLNGCKSERDKTMIVLAYAAGLRISELIGLREDQVDIMAGTIRVIGKGSKERTLMPGKAALWPLRAYFGREDGILWWTERDTPMTVDRAKVNMARLGQRLGMKNVHWHRLRTTFACEVLASGIPLEDLKVLMGHAHISTTAHYADYVINRRALDNMRRLNLGEAVAG